MIHKMIIIEGFVFAWTIFLAMLSDTVIIAAFALIGTLITATASIISLLINKKVVAGQKVLIDVAQNTTSIVKDMSVKQEEVHKQIDGKMSELLSAATGKAAAEAKLEAKEETIEILKQTEPLKDR